MLEAKVYETSPVSRISNELRVVFRLNVEMRQGDLITLRGLTGSLTPSNPVLPANVGGVNVAADWVQDTGTLVLAAPRRFEAGEAMRMSFVLRNSPGAQRARTVEAEIRPAAEGVVLKAALDGAVLASDALPVFVSSYATEDSKVAGQWNLITVCAPTRRQNGIESCVRRKASRQASMFGA